MEMEWGEREGLFESAMDGWMGWMDDNAVT